MADQDDDHEHTDAEHDAQAVIAAKAIGGALNACVSAKVCSAVMLDEFIRAIVAGAIAQEFELSDLVGDLIDEYMDASEAMRMVKQVVLKSVKGSDDVH